MCFPFSLHQNPYPREGNTETCGILVDYWPLLCTDRSELSSVPFLFRCPYLFPLIHSDAVLSECPICLLQQSASPRPSCSHLVVKSQCFAGISHINSWHVLGGWFSFSHCSVIFFIISMNVMLLRKLSDGRKGCNQLDL